MRTRRISRPIVRLCKALLAVASTLFALGSAEVAMRLFDWPLADPVWCEDPVTAFRFASRLNYRHIQPEYDVAFATNAVGMRDDEVGPKQDPRVLLLGDSFTCGYGVERHEMYADLVEKRLGCDLLNAAVGGYETVHQRRYLESRGRGLEPDVVVLAVYLGNDLANNREWTTEGGPLRRVDGRPALNPPHEMKLLSLAKRSVWLRRAWHGLRGQRAQSTLAPWKPDRGYLAHCQRVANPDVRADIAELRRLLAAMHHEAGVQGARLVVLTIPTRVDVEQDASEDWALAYPVQAAASDLERPSHKVSALLDDLGIAHLALLEPLRADHQRLEAPLYYPHDGHLTALGNACVAEHVADWLAGQLPRGAE